MAHITVACATKWYIRVRKSIGVWEYRAQCAHCPVPLPVLVKYFVSHSVTGWWVNLMSRICLRTDVSTFDLVTVL